jgi:hypothetical protein
MSKDNLVSIDAFGSCFLLKRQGYMLKASRDGEVLGRFSPQKTIEALGALLSSIAEEGQLVASDSAIAPLAEDAIRQFSNSSQANIAPNILKKAFASLDYPFSPDDFGKAVSLAEVNYRPGLGDEYCAVCRFFIPPSSCSKVVGTIKSQFVCDLFEPKENTVAVQEPKKRMPIRTQRQLMVQRSAEELLNELRRRRK